MGGPGSGRHAIALCPRGHGREFRNAWNSCAECQRISSAERRRAIPRTRRIGSDPVKKAQGRRRSAKRWRETHPGEAAAYARLRQTRRDQRTPLWADVKKIQIVYKTAQQMQRELGVRMAVDHVIPLKGEAVSGLHVHENLRITTYAENAKKSNSYLCS